MKPIQLTCLTALSALLGLSGTLSLAAPLGTAFTCHGRLAEGGYPASGPTPGVDPNTYALYAPGAGSANSTAANPG